MKRNIVFFSVTDKCNAKCKFCSFWKTKKPTAPKKEQLGMIVKNIRNKLDCGFLQITGGEPLTYPYVFELVKLASDNGMLTQLMSNGSLLTRQMISRLERAGLSAIAFSFDHYDPKIFEQNRGLPNIKKKLKENIAHLTKTKIIIQGGITVSRQNMHSLSKIADHALDFGFEEINFSLPLNSTDSTYLLGNKESDHASISKHEMIRVLDDIIKIKRRFGKRVTNQMAFLQDMKRFYQNKNQKLACKGGERIFYLDNNLDVFRCMTKSTKLGRIDGKIKLLKDSHCYDCPLQCFREGSMYFYRFRSLPFFAKLLTNPLYWRLRR